MTWNREVVRREEENVRLRAEIERLQIVEIASATITDVARLRGWLTEALQGWQDADEAMYDERIGGTPVHDPRIDEIRAEVGQA